MAKNKIKLESNFRAAKNAAHESVAMAIHHAVDEGQETAALRLDVGAGKRGYDLHGSDVGKQAGLRDGKIWYSEWYGHFFEYGTKYIPALPFIRPGHRKMRKTFLIWMGTDFDRWIKKRASVR